MSAVYCLLIADEQFLARTEILGMERHVRHSTPVDPDSGQDPAAADATRESLVERAFVCYGPGPNHIGHALPRSLLRNRI